MLGTGTAIWWVTEPHCMLYKQNEVLPMHPLVFKLKFLSSLRQGTHTKGEGSVQLTSLS
jgi:hypothetical protein